MCYVFKCHLHNSVRKQIPSKIGTYSNLKPIRYLIIFYELFLYKYSMFSSSFFSSKLYTQKLFKCWTKSSGLVKKSQKHGELMGCLCRTAVRTQPQ